MYSEINTILEDGLRNIDILLDNKIQERKLTTPSANATWGDDVNISKSINALKDVAKVISNGCVKFALLLRCKPSEDSMKSLLSELSSHVNIFLAQYFFFLAQPYCDCLFDSVSRAVRTLLSHTQDLLQAAQANKDHVLNYMVGMVNKISEDMNKIPVGNKQAYRILFMENCILVKETIQEFKAYLEEAHAKQTAALESSMNRLDISPEEAAASAGTTATGSGSSVPAGTEAGDNDDEEDFDEDDEEELDYTAREVEVVSSAVQLISKTLGCMKHTLQIATAVCDTVAAQQQQQVATPAETVFTSTTTTASTAATSMSTYSERWVAELARLTQLLKKDVLDLGAELYPPFEADCSVIESRFALLRGHCEDYLRLVDAEALRPCQSVEHANKIAQLRQDVLDCTLV